jgi:ubiquinone/menaquinone biosynthesis C-methylase UbiE
MMNRVCDDQQVTAHEYDRWLRESTFLARWVRFWFSPRRTLWLNTQIRKLPAAAALKSTDRVLDIGCGYGGMLIHLSRTVGFTQPMEGLDSSPLMLARAQAEIRNRKMDDVIHLQLGLATKLPYENATFDVVLCAYVVKHLRDDLLHEMLQEVKRVLKPGGRFCVWEAAPSRYGFMNVWNLLLLRAGNSVVHLRSGEALRAQLEETCFTIERPFGHGLYYFYPPLPRAGFIATRPALTA